MFKKIYKLKRENKIIGFTSLVGDLLHAGHIALLSEAKQKCDFLIVGLLTDPTIDREYKNKPIQTTFERWIELSSLEFVDMVIPFDTEKDLEDMLLLIKPNKRFVGSEYKDKNFTGKNIEGIELVYHNREHSFSSSEIRKRVYLAGEPKESKVEDTAKYIKDKLWNGQ